MSEKKPLLQLTAIAKEFPGTKALRGVDFSLVAGEVHALIGENGAGKSTLIKIIAGLYQQDAGTIEVEGKVVDFHSPADSLEHRIKVVYQELDLVPDLSIAENVFMGNLPKTALRTVDWQALYSRTSELLLDLGLDIDPEIPISALTVAQQQLVEIARALSRQAQIIIMDEPTSALSQTEIECLFAVIRRLQSRGVGIIAGLATGPIVGSIHGYLVTQQKMNSLVTTLGSLFALRGMVYVYTNKTPIIDENGFYDFQDAYYNNLGPVPLPFVLAIILVVLALIVLTQTEFGRNIYAIGGNETAARVSGIKVNLIKFILFVICAGSAAVSGMIITAQTGTGYFDSGSSGFELVVIAGVVLGGIALSGGKGSLVGTVLGILILGMTAKGLRLMGVNTNMQLMVTGSIMILAVFIHSFHDRISIFKKR